MLPPALLSLLCSALAQPGPPDDDIEDIVVIGVSEAEALRRSAEAVTVLDLDRARQQSADLGDVLARAPGVTVQRTGGLGSSARIALAGLSGEQVRYFLDGVPLHLAGYPLGLASVPVDGVERMEVYRGVVPVRLGADALGGAIQLVRRRSPAGASGSVSYQGGSFDTHRGAARAQLVSREGLRAAATAFVDASANDYSIDVEVPDAVGRPQPVTVRRFHDRYDARGGHIELGVVDRPWAERLEVHGFVSDLQADIPHNIVMTVPYGEAHYRVRTAGSLVRYGQPLVPWLHLDAYAGLTHTRTHTTDLGTCAYDWFGRCLLQRPQPGELTSLGADRVVGDHTGHGRVLLDASPSASHQLQLALTPLVFTRTGDDLLVDDERRDPLTARRDLWQLTSGLEHVWRPLDALEQRAFVKHYLQHLVSEEPIPGGTDVHTVERDLGRLGVGEALRLALADRVWLKASYEWATRMPQPEEVFGNAVRIVDNLELRPERSHNLNLGGVVQLEHRAVGAVRIEAHGFGRLADDLIVLLGSDLHYSYQNVLSARSLGAEGSIAWSTLDDTLALDANATWLELRNDSGEGPFAPYRGDRIPNRPHRTANLGLHLGRTDLVTTTDRLGLDLYTRWTAAFYRGWESVGIATFKQEVPGQLTHTAAVSYAVRQHPDLGRRSVHAALEVDNLTDADRFDEFGVQRPGRAVYGKVGVHW